MKHYSIEWHRDHLVATFRDRVGVRDILRASEAWMGDPRFDDISFLIVDFRTVTDAVYTERDFLRVAKYSGVGEQWRRGRPLRVAFVVPNADMEQVVRRYISVAEDNWERQVFASTDAAIAWARNTTGALDDPAMRPDP
jgi:hypothetical protein